MIRIATVFSGIGAPEFALKRLGYEHEVVFACDNGERRLKTSYKDIVKETEGISNSDKDAFITELYSNADCE